MKQRMVMEVYGYVCGKASNIKHANLKKYNAFVTISQEIFSIKIPKIGYSSLKTIYTCSHIIIQNKIFFSKTSIYNNYILKFTIAVLMEQEKGSRFFHEKKKRRGNVLKIDKLWYEFSFQINFWLGNRETISALILSGL